MKGIIKDCTQAKISRWRRACPLTDEQRALARETEELKGRFTATFSRSQNELYEALCDREEFAGLHRATAIFAQGVGSACVRLSRLWDEKRKAPVYPGERLPLTNAPNARILLTNLFRWGKTMPDRSFTTANYYYFGYYFTGNGSVCCGTVQDAK